MTVNFEKVFGYRCDMFAKMLYFDMSRQKVHSKIDFATFVKSFDGIMDEVQKIRNKAIFRILDIRKKGQIEILVLMQLINGLDFNTYFA
jgi:hypothetical protein